jgi:hypothetical protein
MSINNSAGETSKVTISLSSGSYDFNEFDFLYGPDGSVSVIRCIDRSKGYITLKMRRMNIYRWWPARNIQLFFLEKAFHKK